MASLLVDRSVQAMVAANQVDEKEIPVIPPNAEMAADAAACEALARQPVPRANKPGESCGGRPFAGLYYVMMAAHFGFMVWVTNTAFNDGYYYENRHKVRSMRAMFTVTDTFPLPFAFSPPVHLSGCVDACDGMTDRVYDDVYGLAFNAR